MRKPFYLLAMSAIILTACANEKDTMEDKETIPVNTEQSVEENNTDAEQEMTEDEAMNEEQETEEGTDLNSDENMEEDMTTEDSMEENTLDDTLEDLANEEVADEENTPFYFLKNSLWIGMTEEEVTTLLSDPNAIGKDAMNDTDTWRYDFTLTEGYTYTDPLVDGENQVVDTVDTEGIMNGDMEAQLFVKWNEGAISTFTIYYNNNGEVKEYRVFEDGTVKE